MNIRDALILQSPSLALQRAAADEIALLDSDVTILENDLALSNAHYSLAINFITEQGLEDEYEAYIQELVGDVEVH